MDAGGNRYLRLEVDVDADGLADVLEATSSSGSGFESTSVQLTLGRAGVRLRADETFDFSAITAVNPVPRELLDPRHRAALPWVEEALFPRICAGPDPSLAWLLDPKKRLTWIQGPPEMPDFYAVRLAARRVAALQAGLEGTIDPDGEVWLSYAGHAHVYRGPEGRARPLELVREGGRVLLGTAHGVILTDPGRSRHVWIYVSAGGDKLRYPSIAQARLQGDTAIITLQTSRLDPDSPPGGREVRVNLKTGAVSR